MARKVRSGGAAVVRSFEGKSKKVTINLRPEDAEKLRVAAVGLGVDQGDLVTSGLVDVLRGVEVRVRVLSSGCEATETGQEEPPALRVG